MGTILESARAGQVTRKWRSSLRRKGLHPGDVREGIVDGTIVVASGNGRPEIAVGIGRGLRTKVNASIGTSSDMIDLEMELEKARSR